MEKIKNNLLLGILAVVVVFPFLILLMLLSFLFSQKKWEKFWDKFLGSPSQQLSYLIQLLFFNRVKPIPI